MSLPAALSTCTLTLGPYVDLTGAAAMAGRRASIRTSSLVRDLTTGEVLLPRPLVVVLDAGARASVVLPHTDCPGVDPAGFTYELTWEGRRVSDPEPLRFALPRAAGATADLDLLEPSPIAPPVHVPVIAGPPGPPGPGAGGAGAAVTHVQSVPSGAWLIPVAFGRPPAVALWIAGRLEHTDVECLPPYTTARLTFPTPLAGIAVLT